MMDRNFKIPSNLPHESQYHNGLYFPHNSRLLGHLPSDFCGLWYFMLHNMLVLNLTQLHVNMRTSKNAVQSTHLSKNILSVPYNLTSDHKFTNLIFSLLLPLPFILQSTVIWIASSPLISTSMIFLLP